jgi:hypothetical protein
METPVYRIEPDKSEIIIGYACNTPEAISMIEEDRKKVDYDIGYHWQPPVEEKAQ